jgi:hypothetical protein
MAARKKPAFANEEDHDPNVGMFRMAPSSQIVCLAFLTDRMALFILMF